MNPIIKKSLDKSITYQDYRSLINHLVQNNDTTGLEKTVDLINYTKLNDRRMKRWDKILKVPEVTRQKIAAFNKSVTWLVITESWCGDAAHVVPVLNKLAELNPNIDLRLVLRDENLDLMDQFLTNGGRAIAKLIMIDNETGETIDTFGPRPKEATSMVENYKVEFGVLTPAFKEDLQLWYNKNKGQSIIEDITSMLCNFEPTVCN